MRYRGMWSICVHVRHRGSISVLIELRMAKNVYLANSCNEQQNKLSREMGTTALLDFETVVVIVFFRIFDITNQQDKKSLTFFCIKSIMQLYTVRLDVISAIIEQGLFLNYYDFLK